MGKFVMPAAILCFGNREGPGRHQEDGRRRVGGGQPEPVGRFVPPENGSTPGSNSTFSADHAYMPLMFWTPKLVNDAEVLDDPSTDINTRKALLLELDRTNTKYGTYDQYCARFFKWIDQIKLKQDQLSILEIGSGSGGLARELFKKNNNRFSFDYSIMDQDPEILAWTQARLADQQVACSTFPSGNSHLGQFEDKSFDIVISLHVIHHIHPANAVQRMFQDTYRIARRGFFHADFERRLGNAAMAVLVNTISGLSKDLNSDGVKSVKRAYTSKEIKDSLMPVPEPYTAQVEALFPFPHMIISASTRQ